MRTTLILDRELVSRAQALSGIRRENPRRARGPARAHRPRERQAPDRARRLRPPRRRRAAPPSGAAPGGDRRYVGLDRSLPRAQRRSGNLARGGPRHHAPVRHRRAGVRIAGAPRTRSCACWRPCPPRRSRRTTRCWRSSIAIGCHGSGLGWIDVHLLASARLTRQSLWSADRRAAAGGRPARPHRFRLAAQAGQIVPSTRTALPPRIWAICASL